VKLEGGSRETAIAATAAAVIGVAAGSADTVVEIAANCGAVFTKEYAATEPGLTVTAKVLGSETVSALTAESTALVTRVLLALPDGVQAMSMDMPGLVQTSLNFGVLKLRETELYCANTVRSSMTTQKLWILDKVCSIAALAGGATEVTGSYPGWSYNPNSVVKDTILAAYKDLFGKEATVDAVHAGIECGLFADSISDLDCVSIGPEMADVHTPREHLSISSTARTYALLREVLARSK
ncbi:MAG: M20/M25/M40 family metallo-hydrolase, partial [Oscillibacter sp.]|nr:M20/M25/M40 family metallo-hydrolase [Oscillibacter sp.]